MSTPASPGATLASVLGLSAEPCRSVGDLAVHEALSADPRGCLDYFLDELRAIARDEARVELPPKTVFDDGDGGDFRVMPCVVRRPGNARKIVKVVGTNIPQVRVPGQITVGKALRLDPRENFVTHVFDACLLSSARTGVCAALGIELLAPRRRRVAIIGAGRVGYYSGLYAATVQGVESVHFCDVNPGKAGAAASLLGERAPATLVSSGLPDALHGADVAIIATTSRHAVCRPPGWGATLVVSLGADTDRQSELSPDWAGNAEIFVDSSDTTQFGDLRRWLAAGLIERSDIRQLDDVLRHPANPRPLRQRLFVSTGSALFDNLAIGYLLERCGL